MFSHSLAPVSTLTMKIFDAQTERQRTLPAEIVNIAVVTDGVNIRQHPMVTILAMMEMLSARVEIA